MLPASYEVVYGHAWSPLNKQATANSVASLKQRLPACSVPTMSERSGYFVTGTDTGVGKTVVTLGLMQLLQAQGYTLPR